MNKNILPYYINQKYKLFEIFSAINHNKYLLKVQFSYRLKGRKCLAEYFKTYIVCCSAKLRTYSINRKLRIGKTYKLFKQK